MTGASEEDAYSYARFLVQMFPSVAIDILCDQKICKLDEVERHVELACTKIGKKYTIKGLIQERKFDELRNLADVYHGHISATSPAATPVMRGPLDYQPGGPAMPSPPISLGSGPRSVHRNTAPEQITVLYDGEPFPLIVRPSGTDDCFIGEDKLDRFRDLSQNWTSPAANVQLGGRLIGVSKSVNLTYCLPGGSRTHHSQFWVVAPDQIRHADVLLASRPGRSSTQHNNASYSPLSLYANGGGPPPPVPTPPQASSFYAMPSSSGIRSIHSNDGSPVMTHDNHSRDFSATMPHMGSRSSPLRGPRPSQPASTSSRPQSAHSAKINKPPSSSTIVVNVAFQGRNKKLQKVDLDSAAENILAMLEANTHKMSGQPLDRSSHELTVTTLGEGEPESQTCPLDEDDFETYWDAVVEFIRENRSSENSRKPEFFFDLG